MLRGKTSELNAARKTKRLLHILPTLDVGGIQTRLVDIANKLPAGYEHVFLPLDGGRDALSGVRDDVMYRSLSAPSAERSLPARLRAYTRLIQEERPDLLLTYNWGAIEFALANLWTNVPHIHAEDGFGPDEARTQHARRVWTRRLALRRSHVVVPSQTLFELAQRTWRIPAQRLRRIPNGIDLKKFAPRSQQAARAALSFPADAFIVGWIGALRPEKNVERLLQAFAGLGSQSRLVIVGDGPLRVRLQEIAATLGIADRIFWLGLRRDVSAILPALDVLALSSDTEQMPVVVMEAMAAGLPIASVDVGDVRAMVASANAQFITAQSSTPLAAALQTLCGDQSLRRAIGTANHALAQQSFSLITMIDRYDALYSSLSR